MISDSSVLDGGKVPKGKTEVRVWNQYDHTVFALTPDGRMAEMTLARTVSAAAIVCDILWSLTLFGIAAPIADWAFNAWYYVKPDQVALQPTGGALAEWADLSYQTSVAPPAPKAQPPQQPAKKRRK